MTRAATEVMQDVIYAAVIDAIGALKSGAGNLPNNVLRDINAIHANSTFADLPEGMRKSIEASVRAAFSKLLKEGYNVASGSAPAARPSGPPRDRVPVRGGQDRPQRRHGPGDRPGGRDPNGRPPRKPGGAGPRPGGRGPKPGGGGPKS